MTGSLTISADRINIDDLYLRTQNAILFDTHAYVYAPEVKPLYPQTNCRNCGAPLNRHRDCEYCGTPWQDDGRIIVDPPKIGNVKSELIVTGSEIRMSVG